jgi:CRP-like cAMP-binding protein
VHPSLPTSSPHSCRYVIAIRPLEANQTLSDDGQEWFWLRPSGFSAAYVTAVRYTCSLYWALSVMSNLKGHATHETRQCLWHEPLIVDPLGERVYTIAAFLLGASFFSFIYGNIAQFVSNLYKSGVLRTQRMQDADEIASFYRITPELQARLRRHVEFTWAVTKGIDLDRMAGGLPRHLKLEVQLQVNLPMLRKVNFLQELDESLMEELVGKLVLLPVVQHEYVFYEGQSATRMFFINRGIASVVRSGGDRIATLREGDYFGELALLVNSPRTSDVVAETDLLLQALSVDDFKAVMEGHPVAKAHIEAVAEKRRRQLGLTARANVPPQPGQSAPQEDPLQKVKKFAQKWKQKAEATTAQQQQVRRRRASVDGNAAMERVRRPSVSNLAAELLKSLGEPNARRLSLRAHVGGHGRRPSVGGAARRPSISMDHAENVQELVRASERRGSATLGVAQAPASDFTAMERKVNAMGLQIEKLVAAISATSSTGDGAPPQSRGGAGAGLGQMLASDAATKLGGRQAGDGLPLTVDSFLRRDRTAQDTSSSGKAPLAATSDSVLSSTLSASATPPEATAESVTSAPSDWFGRLVGTSESSCARLLGNNAAVGGGTGAEPVGEPAGAPSGVSGLSA